jgi:hypothetical protein
MTQTREVQVLPTKFVGHAVTGTGNDSFLEDCMVLYFLNNARSF